MEVRRGKVGKGKLHGNGNRDWEEWMEGINGGKKGDLPYWPLLTKS